MTFEIRRATERDTTALYGICLRTAADGADASGVFADPDLPGHLYVGPYVRLERELAFVVADGDAVVGYVVGTADTHRFAAECEQRWFPELRRRYPQPRPDDLSADAEVTRLLHRGIITTDASPSHPAHLHIDLEAAAQGHGWGRRLIARFEAQLIAQGVPGFHVVVSANNPGALAFYQRLGLEPRGGDADSVVFVRSLSGSTS